MFLHFFFNFAAKNLVLLFHKTTRFFIPILGAGRQGYSAAAMNDLPLVEKKTSESEGANFSFEDATKLVLDGIKRDSNRSIDGPIETQFMAIIDELNAEATDTLNKVFEEYEVTRRHMIESFERYKNYCINLATGFGYCQCCNRRCKKDWQQDVSHSLYTILQSRFFFHDRTQSRRVVCSVSYLAQGRQDGV